jgi:molybdenum cofactor cytidylyltransferase
MPQTGAIILAAGLSKRMGHDKLNLPFGLNYSFLSNILAGFHTFGSSPVVVVVNPLSEPQARTISTGTGGATVVVVNDAPEKGRFRSLQLGLREIGSDFPVFIQNVDNPFVDAVLLQQMLHAAPDGDFVVPVFNSKGGHPVLLNTVVTLQIIRCSEPSTALNSFLKAYRKVTVPATDSRILLNINTPEDYRDFLRLST